MRQIKLKCVADSSTIIRLRKCGILHLLNDLFETIYIPNEVKNECRDAKTKKAIKNKLFAVVPVKNILSIKNIHKGELEAISLAIELNIDLILLDDSKAIKKSNQLKLKSLSAFDIILTAKNKGLIGSVKQAIDLMFMENEKIDEVRYINVLLKAGEAL